MHGKSPARLPASPGGGREPARRAGLLPCGGSGGIPPEAAIRDDRPRAVDLQSEPMILSCSLSCTPRLPHRPADRRSRLFFPAAVAVALKLRITQKAGDEEAVACKSGRVQLTPGDLDQADRGRSAADGRGRCEGGGGRAPERRAGTRPGGPAPGPPGCDTARAEGPAPRRPSGKKTAATKARGSGHGGPRPWSCGRVAGGRPELPHGAGCATSEASGRAVASRRERVRFRTPSEKEQELKRRTDHQGDQDLRQT